MLFAIPSRMSEADLGDSEGGISIDGLSRGVPVQRPALPPSRLYLKVERSRSAVSL